MAEPFVVAVQGIRSLPDTNEWSDAIELACQRATNATATYARALSEKEMRKQVAFPASYLKPGQGRLIVSKKASSAEDDAVVTGRGRPTSLARFTQGGQPNKPGVTVRVSPNRATYLRGAFLIRLKSGNADIETKNNLGLAVRLKPGERLKNKKRSISMRNGLYLLYGPSVDQVFKDVAEDVAPKAADYMNDEFLRLLRL